MRGRTVLLAASALFISACAVVIAPGGAGATTTGSCPGSRTQPVSSAPTAVVPESTGGCPGYWIATRAGGVFAFGDARFWGSMGGQHLHRRIVAAAAVDGGGYDMLGGDGGMFSFGDAPFLARRLVRRWAAQ